MWRNDGETFTDVAKALGMTGPPRTKDEGGVGCAIGDYDNDGDFDIFAPDYGHNLLYRRNGDGTFTEVGRRRSASASRTTPSAPTGATTTTTATSTCR